jgi:hypothetical protein
MIYTEPIEIGGLVVRCPVWLHSLANSGQWRDLIPFAGCHHCSLFRFSLTGFMSSLRTGREIPSFFIMAIKVVRFSPSRSAAPPDPPITQPASRNACKIRRRAESAVPTLN